MIEGRVQGASSVYWGYCGLINVCVSHMVSSLSPPRFSPILRPSHHFSPPPLTSPRFPSLLPPFPPPPPAPPALPSSITVTHS